MTALSASPTVAAPARLHTPLGTMLALADDAGLLVLDFVDRPGLPDHIARLPIAETMARSTAEGVIDLAFCQLREYFAGHRRDFTLPISPRPGTDFQRRAWNALRDIPFGQTRSYAQQARALGSPRASRAAGLANASNFRAIVIPCHRVVGGDGALTGFAGGLERKRWLLRHEGVLL